MGALALFETERSIITVFVERMVSEIEDFKIARKRSAAFVSIFLI